MLYIIYNVALVVNTLLPKCALIQVSAFFVYLGEGRMERGGGGREEGEGRRCER